MITKAFVTVQVSMRVMTMVTAFVKSMSIPWKDSGHC